MDEARIAYHEAGHAAALFLLGGDLEFVSIAGDGEARGRVRAPRFRDPTVFPVPFPGGERDARPVEDAFDAIVVAYLAACEAEEVATGSCDSRAAAHDRREAARQARRKHGEVPAEYLRWAGRFAAELVRGHWPAVEALARGLLERKHLAGDEARAIALDAR